MDKGEYIIMAKKEYTTAQLWGALRLSWKGYKIAKVNKDRKQMQKYAERINTLQKQLKLPEKKIKY
jgi:hypothetical protein